MTQPTSADRPMLGILLMLGFCAIIPFGDGLAKMLGPQMPLGQMVAVRYAFQVLILLPIVLLTGTSLMMSRRIAFKVLQRTVLHISGIFLMFTALLHLPLADAVAIAFVMPFIMLLISHYFMGEDVGWRRFAACAVGFLGTMLVVQPAFEDVGWPAFLPLAVALIFALFMMITRQIAHDIDPMAMQAASGLMAFAILIPIFALGGLAGWRNFDLAAPDQSLWWLIVAMGVAGTLSHLLMTWSLRFAPAATLAPMQYLEIPFATVVGFMFFREWPNPLAATGIVITILAGLYIIWRERATSAT